MSTVEKYHAMRCRCGLVQGRVALRGSASHAICYCRDCQAYARAIESAPHTLDAAGGTHIVALPPANLEFIAGTEHLACLSLSPRGLFRWYAGCCHTPIGNIPRDPRVHYLGLVHDCLEPPPPTIEESFGPVRVRINTESALTPVAADGGLRKLVAMLPLMKMIVGARITGGWRNNPFFFDGKPRVTVRVLSKSERERQ